MPSARLHLWEDIPLIPTTAGIYRLRVVSTGAIYIGSSVNLQRRCKYWRKVANNHLDTKGTKRITRMVHRSAANDWLFEVVQETPDMSVAELRSLEEQTIRDHMHLGRLLLNTRITS
jgi:excinuclease UvrABC nuclease subunit